jgi:RNA polymerase sigma factor (sigma-70 family)
MMGGGRVFILYQINHIIKKIKLLFHLKLEIMNLIEKAIERGFTNEDLKDVVIIDNISRGDIKAFGELYSKYYNVVFKKLLMLFGDTEKAKDLTSEVMLKVKDNVNKFNVENGSGKVDGWIKTIAHNAFLDIKRKEKVNGNFLFLDKEDVVFELIEESKNVEQNLIENEELEIKDKKFQNAFAKLKNIERQIVMLRFVENLSYDEISKFLNVDSGKLRVILHRAKVKLEKIIK